MKKNDYWKNKIIYSLSKIEYANARINNREPDKNLATVYFILQNYREIDLATLMKVTKLSRASINKTLNLLKDMGVADWDGKYLNTFKQITVTEKQDFRTWAKELEKKVAELKKNKNVCDCGDHTEEEDGVCETCKLIKESDKEHYEKEWVTIKINPDLIIKTKKKKLLDYLAGV